MLQKYIAVVLTLLLLVQGVFVWGAYSFIENGNLLMTIKAAISSDRHEERQAAWEATKNR